MLFDVPYPKLKLSICAACTVQLTDATTSPFVQFCSQQFTLRRQEATSNIRFAYKPFASLSPIHYLNLHKNIYNPPHYSLFIKFHFTFIQQHFCRQLFVMIWDILRVDQPVTSMSGDVFFYLHYGCYCAHYVITVKYRCTRS